VIYGVDARDPMSFLMAAAVLLGVTAVAALIPALRATRIEPTHVLRAD
jgi:ABC-type lipoprotein release transport system permease subunit